MAFTLNRANTHILISVAEQVRVNALPCLQLFKQWLINEQNVQLI